MMTSQKSFMIDQILFMFIIIFFDKFTSSNDTLSFKGLKKIETKYFGLNACFHIVYPSVRSETLRNLFSD